MQNTFLAHYNGNRQPFGLYTHPIHTAVRSYSPVFASIFLSFLLDYISWRLGIEFNDQYDKQIPRLGADEGRG